MQLRSQAQGTAEVDGHDVAHVEVAWHATLTVQGPPAAVSSHYVMLKNILAKEYDADSDLVERYRAKTVAVQHQVKLWLGPKQCHSAFIGTYKVLGAFRLLVPVKQSCIA